jgi:hypothetical protein
MMAAVLWNIFFSEGKTKMLLKCTIKFRWAKLHATVCRAWKYVEGKLFGIMAGFVYLDRWRDKRMRAFFCRWPEDAQLSCSRFLSTLSRRRDEV